MIYPKQEELKILFNYYNGNLYWKNTNKIAGTIDGKGYIHITINQKLYRAHRLIWIFMNGCIEDNLNIDHINGNRLDNRIENLRLSYQSENRYNSKKTENKTTSKYKGVSWYKSRNKWRASTKIDGHCFHIGDFDTEIEAYEAYCKVLKHLAGEFFKP